MKNQVIKVLDEEHGKKVLQYWKDCGVDTRGFAGDQHEGIGRFCYYGVIDGMFDNFRLESVKDEGAEIIELPAEVEAMQDTKASGDGVDEEFWIDPIGRKMLVWDDGSEDAAEERIVIAKLPKEAAYRYVVVSKMDMYYFSYGEPYGTALYKNAKPALEKIRLTLEQISEKFGIPVNLLKIDYKL